MQTAGYFSAMERIQSHAAIVAYPISLPPVSQFMLDGEPATITAIRKNSSFSHGKGAWAEIFAGHVFQENLEQYLNSLGSSEVRTLQDLIQYNKDHADWELPSGESIWNLDP